MNNKSIKFIPIFQRLETFPKFPQISTTPFFSIFSHFLHYSLIFPHLLPKNLLKRRKTPLILIFRPFFLTRSHITHTHPHVNLQLLLLTKTPSIFHFKVLLSDFLPSPYTFYYFLLFSS